MVWENPEAFLLLWLLPLWVAASLYARAKRQRTAESFADRHMGARIFPPYSPELFWLKTLLFSLGLLGVSLALARPKYGEYVETRPARGGDIYVLLDVSRSMLADDVKPSRLARAKSDVKGLLERLRDERVGLITFAGQAIVKCPLTSDRDFFRETLDELDPGAVPRGGTAIGDAIREGLKLFELNAERDQALLLITDGEDHESEPLKAAAEAARRKIAIFTVGLGDPEQGSRVPEDAAQTGKRSGFLAYEGRHVWSKLDENLLGQIALMTKGAYVPTRPRAYDLGELYVEHLARMRGEEVADKFQQRHYDRFQIPLGAGLAAFFLALLLPLYGAPARAQVSFESAPKPSAAPKTSAVIGRTPTASLIFAALLSCGLSATTAAEKAAPVEPPSDGSVPDKTAPPDSVTRKTAPETAVPPAEARKLVAAGIRLYENGHYKEAVEKFGQALTGLPDSQITAFNRGRAHHAAGETKDAENDYLAAATGPDRQTAVKAWFALGCLDAETAHKAVGEDPAGVKAEVWNETREQLRNAVSRWRRCLEMEPTHAEARQNIETTLWWLKHWFDVRMRRERDERRRDADLMQFLEYLLTAQKLLRQNTEALPPARGQALNEYAQLRRDQKYLVEEIPFLKDKIADALTPPQPTAAAGPSAPAQPPPNPPTAENKELEQKREEAKVWLSQKAADAGKAMNVAVKNLTAGDAEGATNAQTQALAELRELWSLVAPFPAILNHDLQAQRGLNEAWEDHLPTPETAAERKETPVPPEKNLRAEWLREQEETARLTDLLAPKALQMAAMIEQQAQAVEKPPAAEKDDQAHVPPNQAEQMEQLKKALQKAVELGPKAAVEMRGAVDALRADRLPEALEKGREALKLLEEIEKELPKSEAQKNQDDQREEENREQQKQADRQKEKEAEEQKQEENERRHSEQKKEKAEEQKPEREKAERMLRLARERERKYRELKRAKEAARYKAAPTDKDW